VQHVRHAGQGALHVRAILDGAVHALQPFLGWQRAMVAERAHAEAPESGVLQQALDERAAHLAGGTRHEEDVGGLHAAGI
jgi:hypothetical protein